MKVIGVISDTHGMLRPQAVAVLAGSSLILHAGDVGGPDILHELERIAPVVAVRGNTDRGEWSRSLPATEVVEVEGKHIYLLHDLETLDLSPQAAGFSMVVYGHTHMPELRRDRGVQYFNPGAAGPQRFTNPVSAGRIEVKASGELRAEILRLL